MFMKDTVPVCLQTCFVNARDALFPRYKLVLCGTDRGVFKEAFDGLSLFLENG